MAIKTVNASNLAEFVAERQKPIGAQTAEQVAEAVAKPVEATQSKEPGSDSPIVDSGSQSIADSPDPGEQTPTAKKGPKPVQPRIDELTREKKELEEFAETEYSGRLAAERRIAELEQQVNQLKAPAEAEAEKPLIRPKPADFSNQEEFDKALDEYESQKITRSVQAQVAKERQKELETRQNELMRTRVEKAKADIPDFAEVIEKRTHSNAMVPAHVRAAIIESEFGPQLAYELAKDAKLEKKIFELSPARALLELGKLELKYSQAEKPSPAAQPDKSAPKTVTQVETTRAPSPPPRLNGDAGVINTDISKPMSFADYKRQRIHQIREKRR